MIIICFNIIFIIEIYLKVFKNKQMSVKTDKKNIMIIDNIKNPNFFKLTRSKSLSPSRYKKNHLIKPHSLQTRTSLIDVDYKKNEEKFCEDQRICLCYQCIENNYGQKCSCCGKRNHTVQYYKSCYSIDEESLLCDSCYSCECCPGCGCGYESGGELCRLCRSE